MVKTASTMLPLGTKAPEFSLLNVDGKTVSVSDFAASPALLVMFLSNHCPFVKHLRGGLVDFAKDFQPKGLGIVAISANDVLGYPDDSPELMAVEAKQQGYTFPYLFDATQSVAKAYKAACTPDFFLFDKQRQLVYRGQFDSSRPGNGQPVTGTDLRAAANAALAGGPIIVDQKPSIGCNIKWIPGKEPDYFTGKSA